MSQFVERFEAAVRTLVADGPVKHRLTRAYTDHLEDLQHTDLPLEDCDALDGLHRAMHQVQPAGNESCVKASVQKMSAIEAAWHATTILELYAELVATGRLGDSLKIVESVDTEAPEAPRYLVGSN